MSNEIVEILVYIAGAIVTIYGAINIFAKKFKNSVEVICKDVTKNIVRENDKELTEEINNIKEMLENYINTSQKKDAIQQEALLHICYDRLCTAYEYYQDKEYIGHHTLFSLEQLYETYKKLGGNGHADMIMEYIRGLKCISAEPLIREKIKSSRRKRHHTENGN